MFKTTGTSSMRILLRAVALSGMLAFMLPAQAAGPSVDELNVLIDQFVKRKMNEIDSQMGVVINLSGRQRMLTQKMSKEMLLIFLGIDVKQNRINLGNSAIMFSDTLKGLMDGDKKVNLPPTTDEAIYKQLERVSSLWQQFSQYVLSTLSGDIDRAFIERMAQENLPLLSEMNKAVYMYEKAAGADLKTLAPVVNLSGRQRMLSQKMTKEFLLVAVHISEDQNKANLTRTTALFDRTLKGLLDGDPGQRLPGTPEADIRAQLGLVQAHWDNYRPVLEAEVFSEAQVKQAAVLNLPLLKEMNTAVKMYEVLSAGGAG